MWYADILGAGSMWARQGTEGHDMASKHSMLKWIARKAQSLANATLELEWVQERVDHDRLSTDDLHYKVALRNFTETRNELEAALREHDALKTC